MKSQSEPSQLIRTTAPNLRKVFLFESPLLSVLQDFMKIFTQMKTIFSFE